MGPGAGRHGGEIVVEGNWETVCAEPESRTGAYLSGKVSVPLPSKRRKLSEKLLIQSPEAHNLKGEDVTFPLKGLVGVCGVSGSGKSSLVNETLVPALRRRLRLGGPAPGPYGGLVGWEKIEKVIEIDQSPIGRTPRSNPATYTGLFGPIRDLLAQVPESKARGYKPGRFSFNVKGGRCEACRGDGVLRIEMHFLPDVFVTCETCKGSRYSQETLEIRYKSRSIAEMLEMTVEEAEEFFAAIEPVRRRLSVLREVGLGYLHLGQSAPTLSGGEAQRLKLTRELSKRPRGHTLYVLDEPTTGLHFDDVARLLSVLQRLVDKGNTVLIIEHNLDILASCDWLIELGPEGGEEGGHVVATGTPERISRLKRSPTASYLSTRLADTKERIKRSMTSG